MIFDYVVVKTIEDEDGNTADEILAEGRILAKNREFALMKIGAEIGAENIVDDIEVHLRPF